MKTKLTLAGVAIVSVLAVTAQCSKTPEDNRLKQHKPTPTSVNVAFVKKG